MTSTIKRLAKLELIRTPSWLPDAMMFEAMGGSVAYGCNDSYSDMDIVGFCMPPKHMLFPHLAGHIDGFGSRPNRFDEFQKHHIADKSTGRNYDLVVYSIVRFFHLCLDNNPNMVDALFIPRRCVIHSTQVYEYIRENRRRFLHGGSWPRFRGYAHSQLAKIKSGTNKSNSKRHGLIEKFGYDTKFAYHIVRLMMECEQILTTGDLILDRDKELYKTVRRGDWSIDELIQWFADQETRLADLHAKSTLPYKADEGEIRDILRTAIEMHYGDLSNVIPSRGSSMEQMLDDLGGLLTRYGRVQGTVKEKRA